MAPPVPTFVSATYLPLISVAAAIPALELSVGATPLLDQVSATAPF